MYVFLLQKGSVLGRLRFNLDLGCLQLLLELCIELS